MKLIVLISCVSKKLSHPAKARDLYQSSLFRKSLRYAETLAPDNVYILSAKYGLVNINDEIAPYDQTLNAMPIEAVRRWAQTVLEQLRMVSNLNEDRFTFLAGDRYRKYLLPHLGQYEVPMKGLSIGRQLQFLQRSE